MTDPLGHGQSVIARATVRSGHDCAGGYGYGNAALRLSSRYPTAAGRFGTSNEWSRETGSRSRWEPRQEFYLSVSVRGGRRGLGTW